MSFNYVRSGRTLQIILSNGRILSAEKSNVNWEAIKTALDAPGTTEEELIDLIDPASTVASVAKLNAEIRWDADQRKLFWGDEEIKTHLTERILQCWADGIDLERWILFAQNLYANPFVGAHNELIDFLETSQLPMTPDGHFLAYKQVDPNYFDCHSHTFDNHVGNIVEMDRDTVDPSRRELCSVGLHFGARGYYGTTVKHGGPGQNHLMLIKVNPRDVVSIPTDYQGHKGRCCRYEVVSEITYNPHDKVWRPVEDVPDDVVTPTPDAVAKAVAKVRKRKPKPATKPGTPTVESPVAGRLTPAKFTALLKRHKTLKGIAEHFNVSQGTVQAWRKKLKL